jgi:hypothetical protein
MKSSVFAAPFMLHHALTLAAVAALLPLRADYATWQAEHFTPAELGDAGLEASLWGDAADPDRDGLLNLAEYAFGGDPRVADRHRAPALALAGPDPQLRFDKVRADIQYRVEYAADLAAPAWSSNGLDDWHAALDSLEAGQPASLGLSDLAPEARFARVQLSGQPPERMPLGTNFWNIRWGYGHGEYFRPRNEINWSTIENPWNSRFLSEIGIYTVLRFMDFVPTNNSSIQRWNQRTLPTADHYATAGGAVAYEWQIDLCNRVGADIWITVPHMTVLDYLSNPADNYWTRLAALVKERLDPGLKVYVEYSNETWNSGFSQSAFCSQQGLNRGFSSDATLARFYFHVYAAVRLHKVFLDTFRDEPERIVKVIACQANNFLGTRAAMRAINGLRDDNTPDPALNPHGLIPDYISIANYISSADGAAPDIREQWAAELENARAIYRLHQREIQRAGHAIPFIAYEGGQHYTLNADKFSRNPESYHMYREWLDMVQEYFDLTMHYTHLGRWNSGGSWGAKDSNTQPVSQAHRYRALLDYAEGR